MQLLYWVLSNGEYVFQMKAQIVIEMQSVFLASWYYNSFQFLLMLIIHFLVFVLFFSVVYNRLEMRE